MSLWLYFFTCFSNNTKPVRGHLPLSGEPTFQKEAPSRVWFIDRNCDLQQHLSRSDPQTEAERWMAANDVVYKIVWRKTAPFRVDNIRMYKIRMVVMMNDDNHVDWIVVGYDENQCVEWAWNRFCVFFMDGKYKQSLCRIDD